MKIKRIICDAFFCTPLIRALPIGHVDKNCLGQTYCIRCPRYDTCASACRRSLLNGSEELLHKIGKLHVTVKRNKRLNPRAGILSHSILMNYPIGNGTYKIKPKKKKSK